MGDEILEIVIEKKNCRIHENCQVRNYCSDSVKIGQDGYPYFENPIPDDEQIFQGILKAMAACPGKCIKIVSD